MGAVRGWVQLSAAPAAGVLLAVLAVPPALATQPPASGPPAAAEVRAPVPKLAWRACHHGFQCATARVPLDYRHPHGRTITLALIRLRATGPGRRIGSLFVNPGGPGGSGVQEVLTDTRLFAPSVRARFDIVGMDPRGVGGSAPVRCFASSAPQQRFRVIERAPAGRAQYRRHVRLARILAARCAARNGALLDHLSTANVARDMDLVRQAVG